MRIRDRGSRPMGASMLDEAVGNRPWAMARYSRCTSRAAIARTSAVMACSDLPTTISPEVSLSRRCTMPALGSRVAPGWCASSAFRERTAPMARSRMHHETSRLVDHHQVLILEQGRQGHRLWAKRQAFGGGHQVDFDALAEAQLSRGGRDASAVDAHVTALDEVLASDCARTPARSRRAPCPDASCGSPPRRRHGVSRRRPQDRRPRPERPHRATTPNL